MNRLIVITCLALACLFSASGHDTGRPHRHRRETAPRHFDPFQKPCMDGWFDCGEGDFCIRPDWVCDFHPDCVNYYARVDEQNCPTKEQCNHTNQFSCDGGETCIGKMYTCNYENDCKDGSDEMLPGCTGNLENDCTATGRFHCDGTQPGDTNYCMYGDYMCDGWVECPNGDDEGEICFTYFDQPEEPRHFDPLQKPCMEGWFDCGEGDFCIRPDWVCDFYPDCVNYYARLDEQNCPTKEQCNHPNQFSCDGGETCIARMYTCNYENDCKDGSDEMLPGCTGNLENDCTATGRFHCNGTQPGDANYCMYGDYMCDGWVECPNGDDEGEICFTYFDQS